MLKRTLFFTTNCRLTCSLSQLVIHKKSVEEKQMIPIEDIGFIIIEHPQISISMPLLEHLVENNVAVIFCDSKHLPHSMLFNLAGHSTQTETIRNQTEITLPLKKNLWKQTIEAKIRNQAALLGKFGKDFLDIQNLSKKVKSGDSDNREGLASRLYWQRLFGKSFIRDRFGDYPNDYLNYGYIILRSAMARSLTGSGLLPSLGIHHKNKYNAFCLADDIMEPYRPYVDSIVYSIYIQNKERCFLDKNMKARLLTLLTEDVKMKSSKRPLMLALSQTTASLAKCFSGESKMVQYPFFN